MMLTKEDMTILQFPFKANEHKFLQGNAYIREDAITERIEQVDPSWEFVYIALPNRTEAGSEKPLIVCVMNLTIKGVTRSGVGMADVTLTKKGDDEANEAEKSAATDALKRAARLFGIGRYLLKLPKNVADVASLREYLIATYSTVPDPFAAPAPQPPQAVTAPAKATKPEPEESRVAELRNEMLTITRIEARTDSAGWYGYGMTDGLETRVNLFAPEDPKKIIDAGYKWITRGTVNWPIILKIQDNCLRIDTVVTSAQPQKPLETPPDAITDAFNWSLIWPKVRPFYNSQDHMRNRVNALKREGAFKSCPDEAAVIAVIVGHKNGQAEGMTG